jgi:Ca-activated chloride channel family protein
MGPATGRVSPGGGAYAGPGAASGPSGPSAAPRPSGAEAVELSVALKKIREGTTVQDLVGADAVVRRVQGKVFFRVAGVWIDGAVTGAALAGQDRVSVKAFSDEYFRLLREQPALRAWFALGERVIVVHGARLFEVEGA